MTAVTWVAGEAVAPLAAFHAAAVLSTADLHAAATLCRLVGEASPDVQLAAALAVRAPGAGHVCLDLATVAQTAAGEGDPALDPGSLPWPDPAAWREAVAASPLVTGAPAPLVLDGDHLYLERYHRYERALLAWIGTHGAEPGADLEPVDDALLARVFPDDDQQRSAGRAVLRRRCTVITGGPGTGKTTTVGRIVGLLAEGWPGPEPPRVALAAPSGKAATRLQDAVRAQAADGRFSPEVAAWLAQTNAQTAHRLLRWRGGTRYGFGPERPLPVDALVLDEASMVSIALVVRLLEALPAHARVVLVGDHEQLASVEAGAVLGDLVAAARAGAPSLRDAVVTLDRVHRFRGGIAALAGALRAGDADTAVSLLRAGGDGLALVEPADGEAGFAALRPLVAGAAAEVVRAAARGDVHAALAGLTGVRLVTPHRRGPDGVEGWTRRIEAWLASAVPGLRAWEPGYAGRPVMVTGNDYRLGLFNGDLGVVVRDADRAMIAFPAAGGEPRLVAPARVGPLETVHAMTVHKAQGSQFGHAVVALPRHPSRLLTRELLYTAVTRAQERVTVVGTEATIRAAIARRVHRVSGIQAGLLASDDAGG